MDKLKKGVGGSKMLRGAAFGDTDEVRSEKPSLSRGR